MNIKATRLRLTQGSIGSSSSIYDWVAAIIISVISYSILDNARDDFSYDYGNYISYFDRLSIYTFDDIASSLEAFFPYPYIFVPPAGFFEVGFATLSWSILTAGASSAQTFSLIATGSIFLRIIYLRRLNLNWTVIALLTIYTVTLFEANAIRLGCALTTTLAALTHLQKQKPIPALGLFMLAASFHLQTLAFSIPYFFCWFFIITAKDSRLIRQVILAITAGFSIIGTISLRLVDAGKIGEYADQVSGAGGINTISIIGACTIIIGTVIFLQARNGRSNFAIWSAALIAAIPSISILIIATDMGAIGDRLWQFSFAMLVAVSGLLFDKPTRHWPYKFALLLCLAFSVFSITIRYPLSNFFFPLTPYSPITPFSLIL